MYISIKFGVGVHVFCWEVGVLNRSCFRSVSCKYIWVRSLGVHECPPLNSAVSVAMTLDGYRCKIEVPRDVRNSKGP